MSFKETLNKVVHQMEGNDNFTDVQPVSGGDINEAYYIRTNNNEYFMKLNKQVDPSFFTIEAKGLSMLKDTKTIDVPAVYGVYEEDGIPMLWLEWIEGNKHNDTDSLLGERLATLHLSEASGFGWEETTYIGKHKQANTILPSWTDYYRDYRLKGQLEIGRNKGLISGKREKNLMKLMERLDKWLPKNPKPSILHGDLWGGNWMVGNNGNPYLIDPSILYGDHEFEIAFTELFGGFSKKFYQAYHATFPLSDSYDDRKDIYQLYYLLVHLNLFGEIYGGTVDRILKKYMD
ncbi:fructosamine kinase family protein [Oceanobacillus senegalensis]|uniref:fructosamine kinase family protein n=1 Tax=Oceanobacillus senegalensis TaxID=1936063 RepID=UPI001FE9EC2B|nr:fructosamine kinase family protein [Oceanobacillus senegalensis]